VGDVNASTVDEKTKLQALIPVATIIAMDTVTARFCIVHQAICYALADLLTTPSSRMQPALLIIL
jgi:hypothetical protein